MNLYKFLTVFLAVTLFSQAAAAHEGDGDGARPITGTGRVQAAIYGGAVLGAVSILAAVFRGGMGSRMKTAFFLVLVAVTAAITSYMVYSILYANIVSPTHGPVHWHARVEFEICGEKHMLPEREIATDKPLHTHGDGLIHVETTPLSLEDVSLHSFFKAIGGRFTNTSLASPTDRGVVNVTNGDLCNGMPGTLKMFVNGKPEPMMGEYVISPIESGNIDGIRIVFGGG